MNRDIKELIKLICKFPLRERKKIIKQLNIMLEEKAVQSREAPLLKIKEKIMEERGIKCPHCKSIEIVGYGKYKKRNRYKCKMCGRTFNELTGTPLAWSHYKEKWRDYLKCLKDGKSIRAIAKQLSISPVTAFDWRHKILNSFKRIGCEKLEGIVEADETFFLYSEKGRKNLKERESRKRGTRFPCGISREWVAVITSRDRQNHTAVGVAGLGRITKKAVEKVIGKYVDEKSTLCTDHHTSYEAFAKEHNINCEQINLSKGYRVKRKIYHIQNVNSYHSRLKNWMKRFHGVATKYLSNYMYWFRIQEKIKNKIDEVNELINYIMVMPGIMNSIEIRKGDTQFSVT